MLSQSKVENFPAIFAAELAVESSVEKRSGTWKCTLSEMLVGEYLIMPQTEWFATELYYVAHDVVRLMNLPACCH